MVKFPYGISDFYDIITNQYFYVDRTDRISAIEETGKQLLFLRPRRFGKSLLLSMLENYYDVAKADEFERLFGHLAIGQKPTGLHNQYFVLTWDFSAVSPQGEAKNIEQGLHRYLNARIQNFAVNYRHLLSTDIQIEPTDAMISFQSVLTAVQQTPYRLYLLIDEYDNFANEIMMGSQQISPSRYTDLLYGEGSLKSLFKVIKSAGAGRGLDRVFITGVSPIVLSDITSGYNVAKNIYLEAEFNDLCGFQESEIVDVLEQLVKVCNFSSDKVGKALTIMQMFYNGYCFSHRAEAFVYNPTLALYFMEHFGKDCQFPHQMLDSNLAMDRGKITYISQLPGGEQLILNALNEEKPLAIQNLASHFGVADMLQETKDNTFMISLLYYFGVLTFGGHTSLGKSILQIPNLVIQKLYFERIQEMLLPNVNRDEILQVAETFYTTGNIQPVCDFIEQRYFKVFDNRDYRWSNELTIKTAFLTLLFNDTFYIMDSEPALDRSYADLTMIIRPGMRQYKLLDILIEFKYASLTEVGLSGEEIRGLSLAELQALAPVQHKLAESKSKLAGYRDTLASTYGNLLRLHSYSVVSVGFERLVWVEESKS